MSTGAVRWISICSRFDRRRLYLIDGFEEITDPRSFYFSKLAIIFNFNVEFRSNSCSRDERADGEEEEDFYCFAWQSLFLELYKISHCVRAKALRGDDEQLTSVTVIERFIHAQFMAPGTIFFVILSLASPPIRSSVLYVSEQSRAKRNVDVTQETKLQNVRINRHGGSSVLF